MLLNTYLVFALGKRKLFQEKVFHILGQEKSIFIQVSVETFLERYIYTSNWKHP